MRDPGDNPCLHCGACCKSFCVSFYWAEAPERGLPDGWTERVAPHISCIKGTNSPRPFCAALGRGDAGPMACTGCQYLVVLRERVENWAPACAGATFSVQRLENHIGIPASSSVVPAKAGT